MSGEAARPDAIRVQTSHVGLETSVATPTELARHTVAERQTVQVFQTDNSGLRLTADAERE